MIGEEFSHVHEFDVFSDSIFWKKKKREKISFCINQFHLDTYIFKNFIFSLDILRISLFQTFIFFF